MVAEEQDTEPEGYERLDEGAVFSEIIRKHNLGRVQTEHIKKLHQERRDLLEDIKGQIERRWEEDNAGVVAYTAGANARRNAITVADVPALGEVLAQVGDCDSINLILESPGGDGPTAEKLVTMCRDFGKVFRVLVPNRAKSAATLMALGADQILMGYCSEIGPIDAQVPIGYAGFQQWVSAQTVIDAEKRLRALYQKRKGNDQDVSDVLSSLAALNPPFVEHCRCLMGFSKKLAKEYLTNMLEGQCSSPQKRGQIVRQVIKRLTQPKEHDVHSRFIHVQEAKRLELGVVSLGKHDELWCAMWDYYNRSFVWTGTTGVPKFVESPHGTLVARPTGNNE